MYDGRTRLAAQVADEVRGHFGDVVLRTAIPRSVRVSEAPELRPDRDDLRPGLAAARCPTSRRPARSRTRPERAAGPGDRRLADANGRRRGGADGEERRAERRSDAAWAGAWAR